VPVYNINITDSGITTATYPVTPSIIPSTPITIGPPPGLTPTGSSVTVWVTSSPDPANTDDNNHPKTVHYTKGTPGPVCQSGCGTSCLLFCSTCGLTCGGICAGCGGVTYPCIGSACPAGTTNPNDGETEECENGATPTAIVTDCAVECLTTVLPSATTSASTSCYTTCSESTACDSTAMTTTTSTTLSCEAQAEYTPWYTDAANQIAPMLGGDSGYGGQVVITAGSTIAAAPTSGPSSPSGANRYSLIAYEDTDPSDPNPSKYWWWTDITGSAWTGSISTAQGYAAGSDSWPTVTDVNSIPFPPVKFTVTVNSKFKGCTYTGTSSGPGTMTCSDGTTIQCVSGALSEVDESGGNVYPKVECYD
jgi:hypothetical protein